MAGTAQTATARCHCGGVEYEVTFPSRFCAHCYCASCRTTHAAGVVTWIGFKKVQVRTVKGEALIRDYVSSPGTHRNFCGHCGTRLGFESENPKWSDEFHPPLALFVTAVDRAPSVNSFEEERPEWAPVHLFEAK